MIINIIHSESNNINTRRSEIEKVLSDIVDPESTTSLLESGWVRSADHIKITGNNDVTVTLTVPGEADYSKEVVDEIKKVS